MASKARWLLLGSLLAMACFTVLATAEERVWTDAAGKFSVTAELVSATDTHVVLRRTDGKEIKVSKNRLSKADLAFLAESTTPPDTEVADPEAARAAIADLAEHFFEDLRTDHRDHVLHLMTEESQEMMKDERSPLAALPTPESGSKSIRPGRFRLDGKVAEIEVRVRAGGESHETKLHVRYEQDQWRVFALSASYPDGDRSINFEAPAPTDVKENPFEELVGKPLKLEGYSLNGQPLDMSHFRGKVVLVDFWATWCGPCRAEIPNIRENWDKHHDDGFEVIAISIDRDLPALEKFIAANPSPWAVVADNSPKTQESMAYRYNVRSIPRFILIGRDGKVASVDCRGRRLGKELDELIGDES